jgi:hypothetical protein
MKMILLLITSLLFSVSSFASNVASLAYASTNVTTSAYVTFVASTPIPTTKIVVCDTSAVLLKMAIGAAGFEVDLLLNPISSCFQFNLTQVIPAGTRISLKAISGTASTGFASVSFFQ